MYGVLRDCNSFYCKCPFFLSNQMLQTEAIRPEQRKKVVLFQNILRQHYVFFWLLISLPSPHLLVYIEK
jgi:hypothetical protein